MHPNNWVQARCAVVGATHTTCRAHFQQPLALRLDQARHPQLNPAHVLPLHILPRTTHVILYETVTRTHNHTYYRPDLSRLDPRTAPELLQLVAAMLQPDPGARPSIEEVLQHPYFGAGWGQPEEFWGALTKWASDDDVGGGSPSGRLWFWVGCRVFGLCGSSGDVT